MKAIVYESNTGFTQKYAFMLSERTGLPAYLLENAMDELNKGDEVFFLGWICQDKIRGYPKAAKLYSVKGIAAVGIRYQDETTIPQLKKKNRIMDLPLFYLQGGVAPERLSFVKRRVLEMTAQSLEKTVEKKEGDRKVINIIWSGGDFIKMENLNEILAFIGENPT